MYYGCKHLCIIIVCNDPYVLVDVWCLIVSHKSVLIGLYVYMNNIFNFIICYFMYLCIRWDVNKILIWIELNCVISPFPETLWWVFFKAGQQMLCKKVPNHLCLKENRQVQNLYSKVLLTLNNKNKWKQNIQSKR